MEHPTHRAVSSRQARINSVLQHRMVTFGFTYQDGTEDVSEVEGQYSDTALDADESDESS